MNNIQNIAKQFNIIYAEDDPDVLEKTSKVFENLFKSVTLVKDGKEGLEKYKEYYTKNKSYYDIVIADIKMPIMDGYELSKKIKEINPLQEILIISAYDDSKMLQNIMNINVSNFIHKPIVFDELLEIIKKINNSLSKQKEDEKKVGELFKLNQEFESLLNGYDSLIIASRTDLNGMITYVSDAFCSISGYSREELLGKSHNIVRHPDMSDAVFRNVWKTISSGKIWKGKVKNLKKDGDFYWTRTSIGPYFDKDANIIGYNSIREDITAQVKAKELHKKVNMLLKYVNDGYIIYGKDLKIHASYSNICLEIFQQSDIAEQNISQLLFNDDEYKKRLFEKGSLKIFSTTNNDKKKAYTSLMPTLTKVNDKHLEISYKIVDNDDIMVVVKDITENIQLQSKLEIKQEHQKMIIQIVANITDFLEIKKDFEDFFATIYTSSQPNEIIIDTNCENILRQLHTFKGLFYQMQMYHIPDTLHNLEEIISNMIKNNLDKKTLDATQDIRDSFQKDMLIIEDMLGSDYIKDQQHKLKNKTVLTKFKYKLKDIIKDPININYKIQTLISQIELISYIDINEVFQKHITLVSLLSHSLNKPMHPLKIKGDKELKVPPSFNNFFRNLVHVYKNAVDHGIESVEQRVLNDKDEKGQISCKYYYRKKNLYIEIADDGNGLDLEVITKKALETGIISIYDLKNLTQEDKIALIFKDNLSTKIVLDDISGRGVGMASLKDSCEALGGTVEVENNIGKGLKYKFKLPMVKIFNCSESFENFEEAVSLLEVISNKIKTFLFNELKIDIIDSRYVDTIDTSNKMHTIIDLEETEDNISICFSYTNNILKKFAQLYFKELLDDDIDFESSKEEIAKEVVNIIVGLTIQDFPHKYKSSILSIPKNITNNELKDITKNPDNKLLSILIQTGYGNIICKLIKKG